MKIHEQTPNPLGPGQAGKAGQTGGGQAAGTSGNRSVDRAGRTDSSQSARGSSGVYSTDPDQVQLSSFSQELRAQTEGTPERLERVDQLRSDYQSGRYQPDSHEVSRSIVEDAIQSDPKTGL